MMMMPSFIKSPYFYIENNRWKLRDDAPKKLKEEFDKFMKAQKELDKTSISA